MTDPRTFAVAAIVAGSVRAGTTNPVAFSVKERLDDEDFVSVPCLHVAGIGRTNDERLFYCRAGAVELLDLSNRVAEANMLGLNFCLPGLGKLSMLSYKIICLAQQGKRLAWFNFDRYGINNLY
jgi:hypothetical protein